MRSRPAIALAGAVAVLAALNIVGNLILPSWSYVPVNLACAVLLIGIARRGGAATTDLGLERDRVRHGVIIGVAAGGILIAVLLVAVALPWTREFFEDERAAGIGAAGLAYRVVIRIPLGTAILEEVAFRGAVHGLCLRIWGFRAAAAVSAVLFGLWHVIPAIDVADGNAGVVGMGTAMIVTGAVVSTALAGLVLTWIRQRAESLVAPIVVHALANSAAFTLAWTVLRN